MKEKRKGAMYGPQINASIFSSNFTLQKSDNFVTKCKHVYDLLENYFY